MQTAARARDEGWDFEGFFIDLMRHLKLDMVGDELRMTLAETYEGGTKLSNFAQAHEVDRWSPLLLAAALSDFKRRVGGEAHVVAIAPDYIEMSQSKCEYGEPKDSPYRGNMCEVCMSVTGAVAGASGIADPEALPTLEGTIARGQRACNFKVPLS